MAKLSKIALTALVACLSTTATLISPIFSFFSSGVLAQTLESKAEAERRFNLCREHLNKEQFGANIQSCQQALAIPQKVGAAEGTRSARNSKSRFLNTLGISSPVTILEDSVIATNKNSGISLSYSQSTFAQTSQDRRTELIQLNQEGLQLLNRGQFRAALEKFQQALVIIREVGDLSTEGTTLSNIGFLLESQQQPELSIVFYKQSINVTEAIRQDLQRLSREQQESYTQTVSGTYRRLADLLLQKDRILEAQQVLDLLKVQELEDYLRNVRGNEQTRRGIVNLPPEQQILDKYGEIQKRAIEIGQELTTLSNNSIMLS